MAQATLQMSAGRDVLPHRHLSLLSATSLPDLLPNAVSVVDV
jgi:hypothetical protein